MVNVVVLLDWIFVNIWLERDIIFDKIEFNCFVFLILIFWIVWFNWFKLEDNLLIWFFCLDEVFNLLESCWIFLFNCFIFIWSVVDWLDNWLVFVVRFFILFV